MFTNTKQSAGMVYPLILHDWIDFLLIIGTGGWSRKVSLMMAWMYWRRGLSDSSTNLLHFRVVDELCQCPFKYNCCCIRTGCQEILDKSQV
ncbi:hypothetical protein QQP08_023818 [Theobroma cacao]|nr:hypothetical protein QQP08_023818 [Theobroma cacao]